MRKKLLPLALALVMCLSLLPMRASAAGADLPDWYFLFAIFKNADADYKNKEGGITHTRYTMPQDEIAAIREHARAFEAYMNGLGVMRAHVDVVEIDTTVTQLGIYEDGSWISPEEAVPLLEDKVVLDQYDHVFSIVSLNISTGYAGLTGGTLENGTGHSCVHFVNCEDCLGSYLQGNVSWTPTIYVHEFLHFMEALSQRSGVKFNLHEIQNIYNSQFVDGWKECYTDTILNRAREGTGTGTGVDPRAWQYPPRVIRTLRETLREVTVPSDMSAIGDKAFQYFANLSDVNIHSGITAIGNAAFEWCTSLEEISIPSSVTRIGEWAFQGCSALTKVSIPGSVTAIEDYAFQNCANLAEINIPSGVTGIGDWAFGCSEERGALTKVTIPVSVTGIGYAAFWNTSVTDVYYGGTEAQWKAIQMGEFNEALTGANIHYSSPQAQQPAGAKTADPTNDKLEVNGSAVRPTVYKIGGSNYFKIRDVAAVLNGTEKQFAVGYAGGKVTVTSGQPYQATGKELAGPPAAAGNASPSNDKIVIDGVETDVTVYKIGGSNYFKLRDLGETLNFYVGWEAGRGICIETDKPYSK